MTITDRIVALLTGQYTAEEIASIVGCGVTANNVRSIAAKKKLPYARLTKKQLAKKTRERISIARGWTDEREQMLRDLWADGFSASQIADRMGGLSRNGVIGKAHRLGLQGRLPKTRTREPGPMKQGVLKKARKQRPTPNHVSRFFNGSGGFAARVEPVVPGPELVIPAAERKGVVDLQPDDCRWPIGDPLKPDFTFCNRKSVQGLPYCEHHARRAYLPPKPKPAANQIIVADEPESVEA